MKAILIGLFGLVSYTIGMGGLACFILYMGGFDFLPIHINSAEPGDLVTALAINTGLIALFGIHHSIAARASFKQALTRLIPESAERSSFVLVSGLILLTICYYWQPIAGVIWEVESTLAAQILTAGYAVGWLIVIISSFLINHFELFGLQQVYLNLRQKPTPKISFTEFGFYHFVRHPLQLGILIGIWCTPLMTVTQLMLAGLLTIYIFIGLYFEERDLVSALGTDYESYQRRVRKILPIPVFSKTDKPLKV